MTPRPASGSLRRYAPYVIAGAVLATFAVLSYRSYAGRSRSSRRLKRSNATRRRNSASRRHPRTAATHSDHEPEGILTDEQLLQTLNQELNVTLPLGIHIPESTAEALTETGHAAQQARGARNGLGGREGRAGRRGSVLDTELSFEEETKENSENQNLLTLLYTIAQDQAQRESYVHRGVTCNNCQVIPIRGIRYRCANCLDYDLCEVCEALDAAHPKTHLFYKIRIPAPFIGNPRQAQVPSYPGKPQMMVMSLGADVIRQLRDSTKLEQAELEALYEQFKVLAASEYNDTKFGIHGAISRDTFDKCFIPNTHLRPPAPNLIYDRMFNFYDTKADGLVDFEEFAIGVSYSNTKSRTPEKLRRVFKGYDLDDDGYVERKDFLRMFKAFYALSKVLVRDIVVSLGDDLYEQGHMEQALNGRQPISAVFTSSIPPPGRSWEKPESAIRADDDDDGGDGDDESGPVVLPNFKDHLSLEGFNRDRVVDLVVSKPDGEEQERMVENLRRSAFWSPPLDDDDEDDLMVPEDERDIGSEVLFQMAMMGINELLDLLFKEKETAAVKAKLDEHTVEPLPDTLAELRAGLGPEEGSTEGSGGGLTAAATDQKAEAEAETDRKRRETIAATREEAKERGGEGRLSFDEFARIMTAGPEASRLDFVGAWADLASF